MLFRSLVVLAVAFNELRRQGSGAKKSFFPGILGSITIPILAILVGTVIFVLTQKTQGVTVGIVAGIIIGLLLGGLKLTESARAQRT